MKINELFSLRCNAEQGRYEIALQRPRGGTDFQFDDDRASTLSPRPMMNDSQP